MFFTDKCAYMTLNQSWLQEKFIVRCSAYIKSILTQIWKLPYMFVFMQKQYTESVAFLFPRILKLFAS